MDISVVVPTYNRSRMVVRTLETLFAQTLSPSRFEVVVVVDGSTDDTAEVLKRMHPACGFQVVEQENRGLAGARNSGFQAARSERILFLDDDMLCDAELVGTHVHAHAGGGCIAAFGAIFLSPDSPRSLAADCFDREIGSSHILRRTKADLPWELRECIFSNTSLSREALDSLGGFDETFRMREDLEFGIRLFETGVQPRPIPAAIAYQYYDKTSADLIRDAKAFAKADFLLAQKHPGARVEGHLSAGAVEDSWKDKTRSVLARRPWLGDLLLVPVCELGERLYPISICRNMGVRALQARRRIHWLHSLMDLRLNPGV